jgi:hypothetical protein
MHLQIRAIAFQEGGVWVGQVLEYDIVAHAPTLSQLRTELSRALVENARISQELGRKPLEGIAPAPEKFQRLWRDADEEVRPVRATKPQSARKAPFVPNVELRLAAAA